MKTFIAALLVFGLMALVPDRPHRELVVSLPDPEELYHARPGDKLVDRYHGDTLFIEFNHGQAGVVRTLIK